MTKTTISVNTGSNFVKGNFAVSVGPPVASSPDNRASLESLDWSTSDSSVMARTDEAVALVAALLTR